MSKKKKGRAWGENGFEDWGGYMAAKRAKLEEQFRDTANKEFGGESSKLFEGISIFVNGYTNPTSDELRRLMMMYGGVYHHYMRPKMTTHVIASNLPYSKIMLYKKSQNPIPICKPEWITDSISAGKILNFQNYLLYSNSTNVQSRLVFPPNEQNNEDNTESIMLDEQDIKESKVPVKINDNKDDINNRDVKHDRINKACKHDTNGSVHDTNFKLSAQSTKDSEFLSAFYSNSRLHYIATMGTTFKNYVNELRDKSNGVFHGLERLMKLKQARDPSALSNYESDSEDESTECFKDYNKAGQKKEPVIMHIDMDCFFVSVGIRNKPELQGLPVAVAHAKGNTFSMNYDGKEEFASLSEIASCSYAARKAGVKNGMFLGEALKMCPTLKTIQYDFEGYKEVSYILYDTVASYTLDIEAVSCDEMYADCTRILEMSGLSPLEFATIIRKEIKQKTNCPVSTGFGNNKLQSRLATRKAKPDGQFYLSRKCAETYISSFNVRDLPGVGGTTAHKLNEMNVRTCEELHKISVGILQKEFGRKMGEQLFKMCRGIDDTKLNLEHVRKSVSAEINYGIRFQNNNDAIDFLKKLSVEVCNRLTAAHAKGRCITLKLMIRAEEAPKEAAKFMGHGLCNFLTRSKNLIAAVDDVNIIEKEVISIWNQLSLTPEDMRGIGIQVSRLEISKNKQNKTNLINFFNKMEKPHTCNKIKNASNNEQLNSHFSEKLDSHKAPLTMKALLPTKDTSAVKINSISSESARFCETTNICNNRHKTPIVQRDTHIEQPMTEVNNERLYEPKSNENIHIKQTNIPGKSNKNVIQTQTSQEKFFKHTKPNTRKSSKYDVPQLQDIDMSVLAELPEDIRNEIFNEYKINKESSLNIVGNGITTQTNNVVCKNEMQHNDDSNVQELCSQIDIDVLTALMESDLHPDVRRDVQIYCNMKKEANELNLKNINHERVTENLQKVCLSSAYHDNDKKVKSNTSKTHASTHVLEGDTVPYINDQLYQKDDINRTEFTTHQISDVLHNNAVIDKVDTFIVHNLNTLHNNENIDKHQEMLINLVNHLFTLPLEQVKMQIQTWVAKSKIVNEVDFLSLATFLSMLPQKKRIEDLHILLKTMHRCTTKTGDCIWHRTYRKTVKHVQRYMQIEYNSNLMVPSIRCNDLRCNNGD